MKLIQTSVNIGLLTLALSLNAHAAETHTEHAHSAAQQQDSLQKEAANSSAASEWADGEVRKVDKSAGKITIKHGSLPKLGMGAMTMVYRVSEPAMLEQVKAGERIRFQAESVHGALTVFKLEPAQ